MNFQLIQKAIQNGWSTDADDFDDIEVDAELTNALALNGFKFSELDSEEVMDWISETKSSKKEGEVIRALAESGSMAKKDLIKAYAEYNGADTVSEIYCVLENEDRVWESDLRRLSKDDVDTYIEHMDDSDPEYDTFLKASGMERYVIGKLSKGSRVDGRDLIEFLEEHVWNIDIETAKSGAFIDSLNDIDADRNSGFRTTYGNKLETVSAIFERFDYDRPLMELYFEKVWGVDEDDFDEKLLEAQVRKEARERKREERRTNRISVKEAREYLENNNFDVQISVGEGHIGLEDMTFDWLSIDGEIQGEKPHFRGGAWYPDRDFGDNSMPKDWFYEKVNKHLAKTSV